jgi:hypothetical protein
MSLKSVLGFLVVLGANGLLFWSFVLKRRVSSEMSLFGAVAVALLVSLAIHFLGGLVDGFAKTFALAILSIPLVWLQGFLTNLVVRFVWEKRVPKPS